MILPENSPKYRWWLRREEMQRSHHHSPAKAGQEPRDEPGRDQPTKGLWIRLNIRVFFPNS